MREKAVEIMYKRSNDRVEGFLRRNGRTIVNEKGEEILLTGWGLGNWLLNEGYMWNSFGNERFDRPRRIERVIEELAGKEYQAYFFEEFRKNYFTEKEIKDMAEQGYNSVRIPIHWRLLMEESEEIRFIESGFQQIDQCLDWCEKHRMYAFIDMHGAPGGQTGANIDDSIDDIPRLFIDEHSYKQAIALWKEIAKRYKDRYIVGGYDLLNEPIRPGSNEIKDYDYLLPRLKEFYEDVIAEIRQIDTKHMFSIEGHHWSTSTAVFDRLYDPNMLIHFHRYGCNPDYQAYEEFIRLSEKWELPLWLGESGENILEWFTAMFPLALELNIGFNLWPAKKMEAINSPYSIRKPKDWDKILSYLSGGMHPGYEESKSILNEYLENIKFENCMMNKAVTASVFRMPGAKVLGIDFDEFPGKGMSYQNNQDHKNEHAHRNNTGMQMITHELPHIPQIGFYNKWDHNSLVLSDNEFACYTFTKITKDCELEICLRGALDGELVVYEDRIEIFRKKFKVANEDERILIPRVLSDSSISEKAVSSLKIEVVKGTATIHYIRLLP